MPAVQQPTVVLVFLRIENRIKRQPVRNRRAAAHRTDRHAAQKQSAIWNVALIAAAIHLQDNNLSLCLLLKFPG